jgi:hypothetical protein
MKERNYIINYKIRAGGVIHIKAKNESEAIKICWKDNDLIENAILSNMDAEIIDIELDEDEEEGEDEESES